MAVVVKVITFLLWGNFLPPLFNIVCGERLNQPLDGGKLWLDGHPIFGPHKTFRGVLATVLGGIAVSSFFDVGWWVVGIAAFLMVSGDLLSSFIKRRLNYASGKSIVILDQLFEGLLPALFLGHYMAMTWWQILAIISLFIPIAYLASLFWKQAFFRPSMKNYPRVVRSTVRIHEWRVRHLPLFRWRTWFIFSNFIYYRILMAWCFKAVGLYSQGLENALKIRVEEETFYFPALSHPFDGFRILFIADLHLDGLDGLTEALIDQIKDIEVDICLIGGDIRMEVYGPIAPCLRHLRRLLPYIRSRHGIFGVLGNHDSIEMVPDFEKAGMLMLINDSLEIEREGEKLWVVGVDDPHYYKVHDVEVAYKTVSDDGFRIFFAHSPEAYVEAAKFRSHLYLCGHTHGGQICLSRGGPIFTNSRVPRYTAVGRWEYKGMMGYTSRGVGASGIPLRFNCPGEISIITLSCG